LGDFVGLGAVDAWSGGALFPRMGANTFIHDYASNHEASNMVICQ
jgi:hypothetical protein